MKRLETGSEEPVSVGTESEELLSAGTGTMVLGRFFVVNFSWRS